MKSNVILSLSVIGLAVLSVPAALLLLGGIMPTLAARYGDTAKNGSKGSIPKTVAFFNIAGIVPFIFELLPIGQNFDAAMKIVKSGVTWLTIYGFAGLGWGVVLIAPMITAIVRRNILRRRINTVVKQQEALKEEWGKGVTQLNGASNT